MKQQLRMIMQKILNTIKVNKTATKQILHQKKFKNFNTLKYKPKRTVKTTNFTFNNKLQQTIQRPTWQKMVNIKKKLMNLKKKLLKQSKKQQHITLNKKYIKAV